MIPPQRPHLPVLCRSLENIFVVTMLLCLTKERPAILLQNKFVPQKVNEIGSKGDQMQIVNFDSVQNRKDQEGMIPAFKLPEGEEIGAGLASSRAIVESWVYKTSQSKGMFQSNIYHLRYYRLNLMMEELKVYEKPDGVAKHVIELS